MRSRRKLPNLRIGVVGASAIGSYYGGRLAHFGRGVHFLLRSDYEIVRQRGLRIRSKGENLYIAKINACRTTEEISHATSFPSRPKPPPTRSCRH